MTSLILEENPNLSQTKFKDIKELYNYIVENQIITEIWFVDKNSLSEESRKLFKKSGQSANLINI